MIKYIVAPLYARPERVNVPVPGVGVPPRYLAEGVVPAEKIPGGIREGFADIDSATTFANGSATQKPGVTFVIYQAIRAVEVPSGPLQEKRFTDTGELVNV